MPSVPLSKRYLSDEDAERLYNQHADLKRSYRDFCPTCNKQGYYFWPTAEDRVECDCQTQLQLYKHYLNANIGKTYQRLTRDDFEGDPILMEQADIYLSNAPQMITRGIGFVMTGSFGTGKTMIANILLKSLLHEGYQVYATTFANMIDMFAAGWSSAEEKEFFLKRVRKTGVLLIDDLGKEFKSKNNLGESTFDAVFRSRVQEGRPTIITTNLSLSEIEVEYGRAIMSLINETSLVIEVEGKDFRTKAGNSKVQEALLGITRPLA